MRTHRNVQKTHTPPYLNLEQIKVMNITITSLILLVATQILLFVVVSNASIEVQEIARKCRPVCAPCHFTCTTASWDGQANGQLPWEEKKRSDREGKRMAILAS